MPKVRVDFFRRSGNWYTTEEMEFAYSSTKPNLAFATSLYNHLKSGLGIRHDDMTAICIKTPYSVPMMMHVDDIFKHLQVDESNLPSQDQEDEIPETHYSFFGY